jgi:hypothetical protein
MLTTLDIAVLRRDCHGRALAHVLFETLEPSDTLTGIISEIFQITKLDTDAVGNLGHRFNVKNLDRVTELCGRWRVTHS